MESKLRKLENAHVLLWLIKDACWVMELRLPGVLMIVPTLIMAFYLSWTSRKLPDDFYHNLAICCWILANSVWMVGEFFFNDQTRPVAICFFALGFVPIAIAYYQSGLISRIFSGYTTEKDH